MLCQSKLAYCICPELSFAEFINQDQLLVKLKKKYQQLEWKSLAETKYSVVKETELEFLSKFNSLTESEVIEFR